MEIRHKLSSNFSRYRPINSQSFQPFIWLKISSMKLTTKYSQCITEIEKKFSKNYRYVDSQMTDALALLTTVSMQQDNARC